MLVKDKIQLISKKLHNICNEPISIMEVCGTHTMALAEHGIRTFLPESIKIISGPGCPVCVTDGTDLQKAMKLASDPNNIITTFGDMLKIPVAGKTLQKFKNVKIIYSPLDSLKIAKDNPQKNIILLGIGFETTTPLIATCILQAREENIKNFFVLPMHKLVPPAVDAIFSTPNITINALLLPGHVSAITGWKYFEPITQYNLSGVVAGFDPLSIMEAIYLLVTLVQAKTPKVLNNYPQLVSEMGNLVAQQKVAQVYTTTDVVWRKIGIIANSGLRIREEYQDFDANRQFDLEIEPLEEPKGCLCGNIMMGQCNPNDCKLFKTICTPTNPIGPCMVSSEGTCAAYYKYL